MDYYDLRDVTKFGISEEALNSYQILFIPENYKDCSEKEQLFNSIDSVDLYKELKSQGINCADFTDLGVEVGFLERRNSDTWLDVIWVLNSIALPFLINILTGILLPKIQKEKTSNKKKPLPKVHIELIIKKGKDDSTSFKYSGDAESLSKILKSLSTGNQDAD